MLRFARRAALASALTTLLAGAATAHAGQIVYNTEPQDGDAQIRVMNDDGTNDRLLVHEDEIPGAEAVLSPFVSPDGTTVVFTARTPGPNSGGLYCGFRCVGIYAYRDGRITRISQDAIDCVGGDPCFGLDTRPRITGDGANVFYELVYGEPTGSGTPDIIGTRYFRSMTPGDGGETEIPPTVCGKSTNVAPNPLVGGEYVTSAYCDNGAYALKVMRMDGTQVQDLAADDDEFANPAVRRDGRMVAAAEGGGDPGLWVYDRQSPDIHRVVSVGWNVDNAPFESSPTFVGTDRLAFLRDDAIRIAPVSCDDCTLGQTTVLAQRADVDTIAWTSQSIADPVRPGPGGGNPGGGAPGTGDGQPAPLPGPGGQQQPGTGAPRGGGAPATALKAPATTKLATALRRGLTVPLTASSTGKLTLKATISGSLARKLKLVRRRTSKPVVVAQGTTTVRKAGTASVTLTFTKAAKRRLRKARSVPLTLQGTLAGAPVSGRTRLAR